MPLISDKDIPQGVIEGQVPPNLKDGFVQRVKGVEFKMSSNDNPMIVLTCEIIHPLQYKAIDGRTYALDTLKVVYYVTLTEKTYGSVLDMLERLGFPREIDTDNPNIDMFRDIVFYGILSSEKDDAMMRKDESGAWVPIKDEDGKPIEGQWRIKTSIQGILHPSSFVSNAPY